MVKEIIEEKKQEHEKAGFWGKLRGNFFTGLLVLMPVVLTLWIFKTLIFSIDEFVQSLIPREYISALSINYDGQVFKALTGETTIPGLGLFIGFFAVVMVGMFAKNIIGKKLFEFSDHVLDRTPLIKSIYSAIKQVTTTIGSTSSSSFREVVMVEYPRTGCWVVAFVSGNTDKNLKKHLTDDKDEEYINVFVPTTPNPTSGFLIFVPRATVKKLDMTVEEGLKLVVSAGIVNPNKTKKLKNKK